MNATLNKTQKLKSRKEIALLFTEGNHVKSYPLKIVFVKNTMSEHKVAFSVPKRNFKLAVHRNRIKRLLREAYRLNKHLIQEENIHLNLMFIYMGNTLPTYQEIQTKVVALLQKINSLEVE